MAEKRPAMKVVRAWAVVYAEDGELSPVGTASRANGPYRWQYPIFATRAEARDYVRENPWGTLRRVEIREVPRGKA